MKVCLTGGIACGKSLLSSYLREFGVSVLDADDVAHSFIPDPAERRRIACEVFADAERRKALEAELHPKILAEIESFHAAAEASGDLAVAVIPLLFELHWESKYDIICTVISEKSKQLDRMTGLRGYDRKEAEARLVAQLPVGYKAAHSHYVIRNDGGPEELREKAERFVAYLKEKAKNV